MAQGDYYGLIEGGGTKFVLGIARSTRDGPTAGAAREAIITRHTIPTQTPSETLGAAIAWRQSESARLNVKLAAIGLASFGPLDMTPGSPSWGHVTTTPKPFWAGTDLIAPFAGAFQCPVALNTDVNGAALAEARWGAGSHLDAAHASLLYLTVGTGVGGGFVSGSGHDTGCLLRGLSHPEMGHIFIPRHPADTDFAGLCPYHGACLEGLAAGPAIKARWGQSLSKLPTDHPAMDIIAWYLAHAVCSYQAIMQPARIVMGGGVMSTPGLMDRVRKQASAADKGYLVCDPATIIVSPVLGNDAGLLGGLALALEA